jgi:plastocyanin
MLSPSRARRTRLAVLLSAGALVAITGATAARDKSVSIEGFAFQPPSVSVTVGDTVTWTNQDSEGHTASLDDGSKSTELLGQGESGSITFTEAGTFGYFCRPHPGMRGTVVVRDAAPEPTAGPTATPTDRPTEAPTDRPTEAPTDRATEAPTDRATEAPGPTGAGEGAGEEATMPPSDMAAITGGGTTDGGQLPPVLVILFGALLVGFLFSRRLVLGAGPR